MRYREIYPPPSLMSFVKCFWILEDPDGPHDVERVLPDGCAEVVIHYGSPFLRHESGLAALQPRSVVAGQLRSSARIQATGPAGMIAARLQPWAAGPLLRDSARQLTDQITPLQMLWGSEVQTLEERIARATGDEERLGILVRQLVKHVEHHLHPGDEVADGLRAALDWITESRGGIAVEEIARRLRWSRRRLERRFVAAVGLPPKALCRIERFQNVVRGLGGPHPPRLIDLAHQAGYADQAHMAREFRELAGLPITRYIEEQHGLNDAFVHGEPAVARSPG